MSISFQAAIGKVTPDTWQQQEEEEEEDHWKSSSHFMKYFKADFVIQNISRLDVRIK